MRRSFPAVSPPPSRSCPDRMYTTTRRRSSPRPRDLLHPYGDPYGGTHGRAGGRAGLRARFAGGWIDATAAVLRFMGSALTAAATVLFMTGAPAGTRGWEVAAHGKG